MTVSAGAIIAGEAVHLCVSPALILGLGPLPRLGVVGAGLGVLASYGTGAAILLTYLVSSRAGVRLRWRLPHVAAIRAVLRVGVPAALTLILWQATTIAATVLMARHGAAALAGYGAAQRMELIQTPISFAFGSAIISTVASNLGAGQTRRALLVGRVAALLCGVIGVAFALIALLAPWAWMAVFTTDPAVAGMGARYLHWVGPTLGCAGVAYGLTFALMGAGRAEVPALASLLRLAVVLAGGIWAGVLGWGADALFGAIALANLVFAAVLVIGGRRMLGR